MTKLETEELALNFSYNFIVNSQFEMSNRNEHANINVKDINLYLL